MVLRELASLGCPSWEVAAASTPPSKMTVFVFGVDAGPDNLGMLCRVKSCLASAPSVAFLAIFCVLHQ
eukprot:8748157-Alexandrium_andersonii.AAC.1